MSRDKILIVDDEQSILSQLKWGLSEEYEVFTAASAEEAVRLLREEKPAVVTLDLALGVRGAEREAGMALLDEIVDAYPMTKVIMVTGNDSRENALSAIRRGAVDWYAKPIELDELRVILKRAVHIRNLELAQPGGPAPARRRYHRLVGERGVEVDQGVARGEGEQPLAALERRARVAELAEHRDRRLAGFEMFRCEREGGVGVGAAVEGGERDLLPDTLGAES